MVIFGLHIPGTAKPEQQPEKEASFSGPVLTEWGGEKFAGGFGETELFSMDYWTLRRRSAQLFTENLYARGLVNRLITNEINTGLTPDVTPIANVVGVDEDELVKWSEDIEDLQSLWANDPAMCDIKQESTMGAIERTARREAFIEGDVLVVLRMHPVLKTPMVQLISGRKVVQPLDVGDKNIQHGVELNSNGGTEAFYIAQGDGTTKRLAARGERGGRIKAWLVFGSQKRMDDVRGEPILSIVLQSLKEIDRYRDSVQRKAVVNSVLAMFIKKGEDKMGTLPMTGGAVRNTTTTVEDSNRTTRTFNADAQLPGLVIQELQHGEEPVGFNSSGIDLAFPQFEEAIIAAVAWVHEMPPEILRLAFSSNYSASQAAINEFKIYLNKIWSSWGAEFDTPIYKEWLLSMVLTQRITAPGLLESYRNKSERYTFAAWMTVNWYGSIKPSTDMLKTAKGAKMLVENAWSTNTQQARGLTGTDFKKNVKQLKRENEQKVIAAKPLADFEQQYGKPVEAFVPLIEDVDNVRITEEA